MIQDLAGEISVKLRRATVDDLPAIVRVLADDHFGVEREHLADPLPDCYGEAFTQIDADPNAYLLVAEREGNVVGFLQLWFLRSVGKKGALQARLGDFFVAGNARGAGVGRRMVEHAVEIARRRGCAYIFLASHQSRADAHRFYQRLGFIPEHLGMTLYLADR